jgi:SAM-dependent methyltransferase
MKAELQQRTIADFGRQWTHYQDNEGYYGSVTLLHDIFTPLLGAADYHGARVAEIGAGTGRIVRMLLQAGAEHVVAVEPSEAFEVLCANLEGYAGRVTCLRCTGDELPASGDLDLVFSVGVLHHIPDPLPTVKAALAALKPGGRIAVWLYGRENNGAYLALAQLLRWLTTRLPHPALAALAWALSWPLAGYLALCRFLPLPLRRYLTLVLAPMSPEKRRLIIYDQLCPAYARYYTRAEALALLDAAGFIDLRTYHRHGYSWSVVGTRPHANT